MNLQSMFKEVKNSKRKVACCFILAMTLFLFYSTMMFDDFIITYSHGLCFLDCVFEANLQNFYEYAVQHSWENWGAYYYWPIYLIFGIWNFPIWIINRIIGIDVYSVRCLLWAKTINIFFLGGVCLCINSLLERYKIEIKSRMISIFIFLSSLIVVMPVLDMSQYDIICAFFILLGINVYCRTTRMEVNSLIILSFASTLKLFSLFIIVPLILLKEKRIIYIILYGLLSCAGIMVSVLPYLHVFTQQGAQTWFNNMWRDRLFESVLPGGNEDISIFVVIYIGICIFAYICNIENVKDIFKHTLWICTVFFWGLFSFVWCHPQWIVLIAPFLSMLIVLDITQIRVKMLLELFMNIGISVYYCYYFNWVYLTKTSFKHLLLPGANEGKYNNFTEIIDAIGLTELMPRFYEVFVVCGLAFIVLSYPKMYEIEPERNDVKVEKGLLYFRIVLLLLYYIGTIFIVYIC